MKFRTEIPLAPSSDVFGYNDSIVLLGSCFAQQIGDKLAYHQFQQTTNPFGVVFHPLALVPLIRRAIQGEPYKEEDIFYANERWQSFEAQLAHKEKTPTLQLLNTALEDTRKGLLGASHIFLTLGTAWGYHRKADQKIVANCHKRPQQEFEKRLTTVSDIRNDLEKVILEVKNINPQVQIILTVSPIRHIKDGFVENTRSKAHLIAAVQELVATEVADYFPAYEILMDDLRDYRFYKQDMIHPSQEAINYIWERFTSVYMDDTAQGTMTQVAQIRRGLAHIPFDSGSVSHQKHLTTLQEKITALKVDYPHMQF